MALNVGDEINAKGDRWLVTEAWPDGAVVVPIPAGATAEDLGEKFQAPRVDRVRDGASTPEGVLAIVDEAFRAALPERIKYPVQVPQGLTLVQWQCMSRTPKGGNLSPEAIAQTLASIVDMGGATSLERVEVHKERIGRGLVFTVRGWKA